MPYRSKAQQRWAHATGQPWAREWDQATKRLKKGKKKGFKALPERVKKARDEKSALYPGMRRASEKPLLQPVRTPGMEFNRAYFPLRAQIERNVRLKPMTTSARRRQRPSRDRSTSSVVSQ